MIFQLVQLIGSIDPTLLDVLRQELNQDQLVQSIETASFEEAEKTFPVLLPDMVVLYTDSIAESLETKGSSVNDYVQAFCEMIRNESPEHRTIIIISSKNASKEDRIHYFLCGADDYLSTDTEPEEYAVRLLVHLRRNVETLSNTQTRLPGMSIFSRIIQRNINLQTPWSLLVVGLNYFQDYADVYGKIPCEQVLKMLAALLKSYVLPPDMVGQTDSDQLLILSTPDKSEKLAAALCAKFDEIVPTFYSERDQKRGYIISVINDQISRRVPFVSLSIGIVHSENHPYQTYQAAYANALEMKQLAKAMYGSRWSSESKRLSGAATSARLERKKQILIIESDAALAFLLKTTLEMQGYELEIAINTEEAKTHLENKNQHVDLVILDALLHGESSGLEICQWIRSQESLQHIYIICTSTLHDRDQTISAGADVYLPKPYEIASLFSWVDYFANMSY